MQIIKPSVCLVTTTARAEISEDVVALFSCDERFIEEIGRTCYHSKDKITPESYKQFVQTQCVKHGHMAMAEFIDIGLRIICDRRTSHQLVRHRMCSFMQESTRYVNYAHERHGGELVLVKQEFKHAETFKEYLELALASERFYLSAIERGEEPQAASAGLLMSVKTLLYMKTNLREWRHIIDLRTAGDAFPQTIEVAKQAEIILNKISPILFPIKEQQ